jgi:hypothetical protein
MIEFAWLLPSSSLSNVRVSQKSRQAGWLRAAALNRSARCPRKTFSEWPTIAAENVKKMSGNGPYRELAEETAHLFMAQRASAPPHVIADVIWRAASTRHPKTRYAAPFSANVILGLRWALSDRLFDWVWGRVMGIAATVGSRQ